MCSSSLEICCNSLLFFNSASFSCIWTLLACSLGKTQKDWKTYFLGTWISHTVSLYLYLTEFLSYGHLCHIWRRLLRPNIISIIFCPIQVFRAKEGHKLGLQVVWLAGCGENLMWDIIRDIVVICSIQIIHASLKEETPHINHIFSPWESQLEFC